MLLIDAMNLRSFGGINLLVYLTNRLDLFKKEYIVLYRSDVMNEQFGDSYVAVEYSPWKRAGILNHHINKYRPSTIIYFGNYPARIKNGTIRSFVSFQNLHLLDVSDNSGFGLFERMLWKLKKLYLKRNLDEAEGYIVPTSFVRAEFLRTYDIEEERVITIPFYDKHYIIRAKKKFETEGIVKSKNTFIYNGSTHGHKNHINLLAAWRLLLIEGKKPLLKLTIPPHGADEILSIVKELQDQGASIVNLTKNGYLEYIEILREIYTSEYTIFPSLNETFGFGQVEGALLGNKVLSSNRDHVFPVIQPSSIFDPLDPKSIMKSVVDCLHNEVEESILHFDDHIDELITQLY